MSTGAPTSSGGGGDGGDTMIWVYETWGLTSSVNPMYSYTDEADLHTRVMVRDTNAGYHTTNTSISTRAVFTDIDSETFLTRFAREYPNYSTNSNYATGLASRNDDVGNTVIVVNTSGRDSVELGRGWVTDSDFVSLMAAWGITINMAPNYGTVVYYTDDTYTTTNAVVIPELETIYEMSGDSATSIYGTQWTADVAGIQIPCERVKEITLTNLVTGLPASFLSSCSHLDTCNISSAQITQIPNFFMASCRIFNKPLALPSRVTSIGTNFMLNCSAFNSNLSLPSSLKTIGSYFLHQCTSFNKDITLPSTLTSIGGWFFSRCNSMVSSINVGALAPSIVGVPAIQNFSTNSASAKCYTTGITIKGSNRAAWISTFPNRTASPYRRLINGGS